MTHNASAADARTLALAHYAARGVLEHVLSGHGITFNEQVPCAPPSQLRRR